MTKLLITMAALGIFLGLDACRVNETVKKTGSSSLLWKVHGNGLTETSYLYGTIHIQDERVFNYGEPVKKAFENCSQVAVEVLMDKIDPSALMSTMFMEDTTLDMLLSPAEYQKLEEVYKSVTGAGLETANNLKPFFISANLVQSLTPRDMQMPLDMYFVQQARQNDKNVIGLETLQEQIDIIDGLSYSKQADMLLESIEDMKEMKDQFKQLIDAYLQMNSNKITELMDDPSLPDEFMEQILTERNKLMVERMSKYFKVAGTFTAVGAAHLYGNDGIIQMLKDKGYKVEPVAFEFDTAEKSE